MSIYEILNGNTNIGGKEATMKLKTLEELQRVAEVRPPLTRDRMSKRQLLERWAEVLELAPQRYLHVTDIGCRGFVRLTPIRLNL